MAYTSPVSISSTDTSNKTEIYSKENDGLGPLEWTFTLDGAADLYFTGGAFGPDVAVPYPAGTYSYGTPTRGITKIEGVVAGAAVSIIIHPSVA